MVIVGIYYFDIIIFLIIIIKVIVILVSIIILNLFQLYYRRMDGWMDGLMDRGMDEELFVFSTFRSDMWISLILLLDWKQLNI